ncbi:selenide, water dikinase SelD [Helicobacter enhydrae]|uniref:Selenide, water dikinase SelD n=1 Tax=Helicobacter enhydrae TaxID=222136 RepID=A0A1B1U6M5_9HELI|nr:selenide, water dikinase SelD [Helicobacter enhydrae]
MAGIETYRSDALMVGFDGSDDAGVFALSEEIALVESVDFITPIVEDPFVYGQIASANALSDIFAMGGVPKTAMNLLMWDKEHISQEMVREILRGGSERLEEAKVSLVGGHSVNDLEQKYGLSVSGVVHPQKIWRNCSGQIGDALVLSKPLGSGILASALKGNKVKFDKDLEGVVSMVMLNQKASEVARGFEIHACTDVTGFGLIGHLREMCSEDKSAMIEVERVPLMAGVLELIAMGIVPNGSLQNHRYLESSVQCEKEIAGQIALFDAQTSGGLLFALPKRQADGLVDALKRAGYARSAVIGEFVAKREKTIILG